MHQGQPDDVNMVTNSSLETRIKALAQIFLQISEFSKNSIHKQQGS
jgi:hypothetical protein